MKFTLFVLMLFLLSPVQAAAEAKAKEELNLAYVKNGHPLQKLDLYLPAAGKPLNPLVIWIHGGAWEGGSKTKCPAKFLVAQGYVVASLDYRLSQTALFPAQIQDCKAAVRWLRAHAQDYQIDPKRIGVWGGSAGGHLAALLGTTKQLKAFDVGGHLDQSSEVQCVVDWFGPTDFLRYGSPQKFDPQDPKNAAAKLFGGPVSSKLELAKMASPIYYVQAAQTAPFLIVHGDQDELVPLQQSESFFQALRAAKIDSSLTVIPGANHGGPIFYQEASLTLVADFFRHHLQAEAKR